MNHLARADLIFPGQQLIIPVHFLRGVPIKGLVTFLKGQVEMMPPGAESWQRLEADAAVQEGSSISTGHDGSVEITFPNGDALLLRPGASLTVSKARQKSETYFAFDFFLRAGRAISKVRKITGKEKQFKITTPSAIAGARGGRHSGHRSMRSMPPVVRSSRDWSE